MAEYIIYKKAQGVFEIIKDGGEAISDSKWSGTNINGAFNFKSENGARLFSNVPFSEVSYIDETGGGSVSSFASAISLHTKLKEVGFFDSSVSSGGGGADTFKQLADTFSSFTGRNNQVIYINGNVLDSKTIANNEFLSQLGDTNLELIQNIPAGHILQVVTIIEGDQTIKRWAAVPFPTQDNTPPNGFIQLGTVAREGSDVNVSTGYLWIIDGIQLGNSIDYDFPIEDAATGDSRVDIIVANNDGTFELIQGLPSEGQGSAVSPVPNTQQLLLTTINIYEDNISEPTIPISDGIYVNKVEYQYQGVNGTGDGILTDYPLNGINSALDLVSGVTRLNSVFITSAYSLYKGKELVVRNSQLTNVPITNGMGFNFHNGEDFILLPGQVIKFKEYGLEFDFLGTFGGGGSSITNTDELPEGSVNRYFTESRVLATGLTGLSFLSGVAITALDTVIGAFGKLQKQITDNIAAINLRELISNKSDTGTLGTSTTLYPTQRSVKQYVDDRLKPWLDMPTLHWYQATGAQMTTTGTNPVSVQGSASQIYSNLTGFSSVRYISTNVAGQIVYFRESSFARLFSNKGFYMDQRVKNSDASPISDGRVHYGFMTTALVTNQDPSAVNRGFGLMADASDVNLNIGYSNTTTGLYTKISLGSSFSKTSTDDLIVTFYRLENTTTVFYSITNASTLANSTGSFTFINNTGLTLYNWKTNNASAIACGIDIYRCKIYLAD